jgi:hypothetical protein
MHRPGFAQVSFIALASTCAWALLGQAAVADVTVQEQSTFDLSFIKAHDTSTELTSGDKQRRDSDIHCDGVMSLLCRNLGGGGPKRGAGITPDVKALDNRKTKRDEALDVAVRTAVRGHA